MQLLDIQSIRNGISKLFVPPDKLTNSLARSYLCKMMGIVQRRNPCAREYEGTGRRRVVGDGWRTKNKAGKREDLNDPQ